MKAMLTPRKMSIGRDTAAKDGLDPQMLSGQGWRLKDKSWYKSVAVPQLVESVHENDGPPDVGTPSVTDLTTAVQALMHEPFNIPADKLAEIINNGLYLEENSKSKPRALSSVSGLEMAFATSNPSNADKTAFLNAILAQKKEDFLRSWYKARQEQAAA